MHESDAELVVKAQRGDRAAFEELVRRTTRLVFARVYLDVGDRHRTEDLVQETWLRAYHALGGLNEPATLRSWLLTIAQNVVTDAARHNSRQKRATPPSARHASLAAMAQAAPLPDEEAARAEMRDRALAVLRSLPEEYRLPLTLRYLTGADYEAITAQLGLTNGSLRGLLHRGLKMLRSRLEPPQDAGD
jgi:RNA polymerase sigma-70 factor, ECF subfamily